MNKDVDFEIPKTFYGSLQYASEIAYDALVDHMIKEGFLPKGSNLHLMYNPSQEVTQQFKDSCKAVIVMLSVGDKVE